jgi:hypothetical protein
MKPDSHSNDELESPALPAPVDEQNPPQAQTKTDLDALLPASLERAFRGEL